jgi:hypothetical protein
MRIWIAVTACSACFAGFLMEKAAGQVVVLTNGSLPATSGVVIGGTPGASDATPVLTPQDVAPNLFTSNATPALGRPNVTSVTPSSTIIPQSPGAAIGTSTQSFTTAIGQQGSGTAIGQQGMTAIGQQGVGTAIFPETNAVVIGQPQPFTPPAPPVTSPAIGTITNALGQTLPMPSAAFTNAPAINTVPAVNSPSTVVPVVPTPTGRRR